MPANQKKYNYYCLENTHIVTNTVLKEGYIMGHNILRHASLGLYNHFDILMKQSITVRYLITVVIRILQYPYVSVCGCMSVNIFPVNIQIMPIHPYFPL